MTKLCSATGVSTVIQCRHPSYPSIDANENTELETNLRDLISYKILPSTLASRVVTHGSSVSPIASCHLTRQCHFAVAASSSNPHHPDLLSCSFIGGGGFPISRRMPVQVLKLECNPPHSSSLLWHGEALSLTPVSTRNKSAGTHRSAKLTKPLERAS